MPTEDLSPDWLRQAVRAELRARRMSQRGLALKSGVEHSTISRFLNGRAPSWATGVRLMRALDLKPPSSDAGLAAVRPAPRPPNGAMSYRVLALSREIDRVRTGLSRDRDAQRFDPDRYADVWQALGRLEKGLELLLDEAARASVRA